MITFKTCLICILVLSPVYIDNSAYALTPADITKAQDLLQKVDRLKGDIKALDNATSIIITIRVPLPLSVSTGGCCSALNYYENGHTEEVETKNFKFVKEGLQKELDDTTAELKKLNVDLPVCVPDKKDK